MVEEKALCRCAGEHSQSQGHLVEYRVHRTLSQVRRRRKGGEGSQVQQLGGPKESRQGTGYQSGYYIGKGSQAPGQEFRIGGRVCQLGGLC